jgi:acetylglutamate kinase
LTLVVVKLGGRVAVQAAKLACTLRDGGNTVVVVHGAGPQITAELERQGIEPLFVNGRRVTTPAVLKVVRASLAEINAELCAAIGEDAVGLMGDEIGLRATPVGALGLVGDPEPSAPVAVTQALAAGRIPVIAPLAEGPLNVNADEAAAALAIGLGASQIRFVSDVPGVFVDDDVIDRLGAATVEEMLAAGRFEGGIVPKLNAALSAVRAGVIASIGRTEVVA